MLHVALVFLCVAQLIHFCHHWFVLSTVQLKEHRDQKLRAHLDWSETASRQVYGNSRPGSALNSQG